MAHKSTLALPESIGQLDPSLLTHLQSNFPDLDEGFTWYAGKRQTLEERRLFTALGPILDMVTASEVVSGLREPEKIQFSVDTCGVDPADSQRGDEWHIDGLPAYVVADVLPTEFMVGRSASAACRNAIAEHLIHRVNQGDTTIADEDLVGVDVEVYAPEPFEMVRMVENIHRSPLNRSTQRLSRTWVRVVAT